MASSVQAGATAQRSRLLRLAIWTSGVSKITGAVLQGLAIPLVYHALGTHEYALFLLLSAALATVSLTQLGAGPALSQTIAKANAQEDYEEEGRAFASAFLFTAGISCLAGLGMSILVRLVSPAHLLGVSYSNDGPQVIHIVDSAVFIVIFIAIAGVIDSAISGYQEQSHTNLGVCASNLGSALVLIFISMHHATVTQVMAAIYLLPSSGRLVNLIMLLKKRPYLLDGFTNMNRHTMKTMVHSGTAFWIIQVSGVVEQHGGTYIMARLTTPQATDTFGIVYRSVSLLTSVVGIVTQPLWPAFTDAVARHDSPWIQIAIRKIKSSLMALAAILAGVLAIAGAWLMRHVWHIDLPHSTFLLTIFGIYLFMNVWTHFHYIIMMGLDRVWGVAWVVLFENSTMIACGLLLTSRFQALGMATAYLIASLALPTWLLPFVLKRRLKDIKAASPTQ